MSDITLLQTPTHKQLEAQVALLLDPAEPLVTQLANLSSLLYWSIANLNWVGIYILREGTLYLGPFQGKPACTVIAPGRGVCGAAVRERRTQHVPDVHAFPGHIACDSTSNAEVVVPLIVNDVVWGVLDIDSPLAQRFSPEDVAFFERVGALAAERCNTAGGHLFPLDKA